MLADRAGVERTGQPSVYEIVRARKPIKIDAKLNDSAWKKARVVRPFQFNWWVAGEKEGTDTRMVWDDENLYVSWYCHDRHISASITQRH